LERPILLSQRPGVYCCCQEKYGSCRVGKTACFRRIYKAALTEGGSIMAFGIGVFVVSGIVTYEIEKRLPSVKKN
jgi:hypothetical protein